MSEKTLWVVGGGVEAVPGIKRAKQLGLFVVVADGNPEAPGFAFADDTAVCSTYDATEMAMAAGYYSQEHRRIDGVIAMCADVPLTVASVAAECSLPGLPIEVAQLGTDKLAMKQKLQQVGVLTARGIEVRGPEALRQAMALFGGPYACVVKPVDSRGARGVVRVGPDDNLQWAYDQARAESPSGRVMVEEWFRGPQYSTETLFRADGPHTFIMERNYSRLAEFAPYIIEDGAQGPARLDSHGDFANHDEIENIICDAVWGMMPIPKLLPVTIKGDIVWTKDGPAIIELALRLSGGYMSTELIPRMTGVDFIGHAIWAALGVDVGPVHELRHRGVAIRYDIPPGCKSHPERRGHAIAEGETREEAVAKAEAMVAAGELVV